MPGKILVIHEFGVMRRIIVNYCLTEFSEMEVRAVASAEEGLAVLAETKFDVVLCALEMSGQDGLAFRDRVRRIDLNRETPVVIITSTDTENQRRRLERHGVRHYLIVPFTPRELRQKVGAALDPRGRRTYPRYGVPGTRAVIERPDGISSGEVINLSQGGLLVDLEYPPQGADFLRPSLISVAFPDEYGQAKAANIVGCLVRLTVQGWNEENLPVLVRTAWRFVDLPTAAAKTLDMALERIQKDYLLIEQAATQKLADKDETDWPEEQG